MEDTQGVYELGSDLAEHIQGMTKNLKMYRRKNAIRKSFFEGKSVAPQVGVRSQLSAAFSVGWSKIVVETLNERIALQGYLGDDADSDYLNQIFEENFLSEESTLGHEASFTYGVSCVVVGRGEPKNDEPETLVTVESPFNITFTWNRRRRRVSDALQLERSSTIGDQWEGAYYTDTHIVPVLVTNGVATLDPRFEVIEHLYERVPVVPLFNRREAATGRGHSEITETVMKLVDDAQRTLAGMAENREYYSNPQRYYLNVSEEMFAPEVAPEGLTEAEEEEWKSEQGRSRMGGTLTSDTLALPFNESAGENGQAVQVGSFAVGSPAAFTEVLRAQGAQVAAESSIPLERLGFQTANPSSADALRAQESGLVKKARARILSFSRAWREVARLILITKHGYVPEGATLEPFFLEPDSAARTAAAQEVVTLVQAGIVQPDSAIVLNRLGLSKQEQEVVATENRRAQAAAFSRALARLEETEEEEAASSADLFSTDATGGITEVLSE